MSLAVRRIKRPRKHHKAEEIVAKLRQVDVLTSQGKSMADAIRAIGVTEVDLPRICGERFKVYAACLSN
jgi:hypothetical protein